MGHYFKEVEMPLLSSNVRRQQHRHYKLRSKQLNLNEPYMKNIVFFTGAGISADSGIPTFRGEDGLWNDPKKIIYSQSTSIRTDLAGFLDYHNKRRRQMLDVEPSLAHRLIADLQRSFCVRVITQNIDDLHEKSGCQQIVHLHGSILHMRPQGFQTKKYRLPWESDIHVGDRCPKTGAQLRPDIVLFGERIYDYYRARKWICEADSLVVIGSSLLVEPAASLLRCVYRKAAVFYINTECFQEKRLPIPGEQYVGTANDMMTLVSERIRQHV